MLDENEHLKSQLRQQDRDITLMNDRIRKISGESENIDREAKRVNLTLTEKELKLESFEKKKNEL